MLRDLIHKLDSNIKCTIMWNNDFVQWGEMAEKIRYPNKIDKIKNFGVFVGTTKTAEGCILRRKTQYLVKYVNQGGGAAPEVNFSYRL